MMNFYRYIHFNRKIKRKNVCKNTLELWLNLARFRNSFLGMREVDGTSHNRIIYYNIYACIIGVSNMKV